MLSTYVGSVPRRYVAPKFSGPDPLCPPFLIESFTDYQLAIMQGTRAFKIIHTQLKKFVPAYTAKCTCASPHVFIEYWFLLINMQTGLIFKRQFTN